MAIRVVTAEVPALSGQNNHVAISAELVAHAGTIHGTMFMARKTMAQKRPIRQKPVTTVSPVASVQRVISILMKYCIVTPTMQAQKNTN